MSSGERMEVGEQGGVDFADDVAFEASHDLFLSESLLGASLHVGAGAGVVAHAAQHDGVQGVVGCPVAAAVEPVSVGAPGAGGGRRGAAQVGQGGLGAEPFLVSPAVVSSWPAPSGPAPDGAGARARPALSPPVTGPGMLGIGMTMSTTLSVAEVKAHLS